MKIYYFNIIAFQVGLLVNAGPGFKCHLGGYGNYCCENDGQGPGCSDIGDGGCEPYNLNEIKDCDETKSEI